MRQRLENHQVALYFGAVALGGLLALLLPGTAALEAAIEPALGLMLFVTFLQVPLAAIGRAFAELRFLLALLLGNFLAVPLLVALLLPLFPGDPMIRLGMLLVLLTPCIDYVVTFAHLGRAEARLILAATPLLLLVQMLLLPLYLGLLLDEAAAALVSLEPFLLAFLWLIVLPLLLAGLCQLWAARSGLGAALVRGLGLLPVPATALVLFLVVAGVLPRLAGAAGAVAAALPFYLAFALVAPLLGWWLGRAFRLPAAAARAVAFSTATRNSLVVLPLALAVPGGLPLLPAVVVAQTLVELVAELLYIRVLPRLGSQQRENEPA